MNFPSPEVLKLFKETRGAISVHEACAIYWLAQQAPEGDAIDLGTHCGKAAVMAAAGFISDRKFHLVDPGFDVTNEEAWKHSCQGSADKAWSGFKDSGFVDKIQWAIAETNYPGLGLVDGEYHTTMRIVAPVFHGDYSLHAIPSINGPFSFAFIDSDQHQYELVKAELELLRNRMVIGGIIGLHDFASQFGGVEQAMREMLPGGQYEEIGIPWQDIKPWVEENGGEEGNSSWHKCGEQQPCYVGAIVRRK